jgi:hypothetical protein
MKNSHAAILIAIFMLVCLYMMMPSRSSYTSKAPRPAAPCSCNKPERDGVYMPSLIKTPDSMKDSREYTFNM